MNEQTYRERLEAVAEQFPTGSIKYHHNPDFRHHKVEFYVVRGEETYAVDLYIFENRLEQNISASVYRRRPWTCLAMIAYVEDSLLAEMIAQILGTNEQRVLRYPGDFAGIDPDAILIDNDGDPLYAESMSDSSGKFPTYNRHFLPAVVVASGKQTRAVHKLIEENM